MLGKENAKCNCSVPKVDLLAEQQHVPLQWPLEAPQW